MTGWSTTFEGVAIEVAAVRDPDGAEQLDVRVAVDDRGELALERLLAALRHATSHGELAVRGVEGAYRVEDVRVVEAAVPFDDVNGDGGERWLRRRLSRGTDVRVAAPDGLARARAIFARRGDLPTSQRREYTRVGGKIQVEAFELHVVEHCNLRCAHCCNMSPYLAERTQSVAEIAAMCETMAAQLEVDVFKIMGGEPLLHPEITEVVRAIKRSGISDTIRLFTNGLRLHAMDDAFWGELDELTISNYASAPVKPAMLVEIKAKARRFGVVLNVKPVGEFSEVMRGDREPDDAGVQRTYEACWLRHRCLVVRGGKFYMCTRAAYAEEYHRDLAHGAYPDDRERALADDGVTLARPDLGAALLAYLNRAEPLASCRFCHGGAGPVNPHAQLSKADVRAGRLHPLRVSRS